MRFYNNKKSQWGRDFSHLSRPALRPTQPPVQPLTPFQCRSQKQSRAIFPLSPRAFVAYESLKPTKPRTRGLNDSSAYVGFFIGTVALGQVSLRMRLSSHNNIFPPIFHNRLLAYHRRYLLKLNNGHHVKLQTTTSLFICKLTAWQHSGFYQQQVGRQNSRKWGLRGFIGLPQTTFQYTRSGTALRNWQAFFRYTAIEYLKKVKVLLKKWHKKEYRPFGAV